MYDSQTSILARLRDLERRVDELTPPIFGELEPEYEVGELAALYADASTGPEALTPQLANLWVSVIKKLNVTALNTLGKHVADPFPWKPFLHVLDLMHSKGFRVEDATAHLLRLAQDLLRIQGLSKLRVEDVIARPSRISEAFLSYQRMRIGGTTT